MRYPGLGIIGSDKLSGIYGVNEGIRDSKGTGIRHLFYGDFSSDLVHSATTVVRHKESLYYGNRKHSAGTHPVHLRPAKSSSPSGYIFRDEFECGEFTKVDEAFAWGEASIDFNCEVRNESQSPLELTVMSYLVFRPGAVQAVEFDNGRLIASSGEACWRITADLTDRVLLVEDAPTGFLHRANHLLMTQEYSTRPIGSNQDAFLVVCLGGDIVLTESDKTAFHWSLDVTNTGDIAATDAPIDRHAAAQKYWEVFFERGNEIDGVYPELDKANRVAIKSSMLDGFVPADLTGHYYSDGLPCCYARDALMVARAFLIAGYKTEAAEILRFVLSWPSEVGGAIPQRIRGDKQVKLGANNDVVLQLDSLGYSFWLLAQFHDEEREQIVSKNRLNELIASVSKYNSKQGLLGPEGGVNEGVFGPAYIVATNMCIAGGLKALSNTLSDLNLAQQLKSIANRLVDSIDVCQSNGMGYRYGFVEDQDELVEKYDTPQLFGGLYGFPITEGFLLTYSHLLNNASFFEDGIGYTEQEYHHGPWCFNTAAFAQFAYLIGDDNQHYKKLAWLASHSNKYGLLPEAIDADDEANCFINPLVWACAEFLAALHIEKASVK
jgi:hypothetical protein